jgi:alpha-mannosidase
VEVAIDAGWIVIDGIRLSLFDEPDVGDLYNFSPVEGAKPLGPTELTANGQRVTARFFNDLEVEIDVSRAEQEPFFRLEGVIRNERPDHRLRLHVALPQEVTRALAGAPFELVERDLVSEGSDLESPSPTWPARGMVLAGGVAILAEGVFEYEVVDGKQLAVTLLRCVGTISRGHLATRPSPAGPDIATPDAQMIGDTHFALGVYASASRRELTREWERFALPLVSAQASGGGSLPSSGSLLEISGAELSSVRRRDGKIEVRMWNASKEPVSAALDGRAVQLRPAAIVLEVLERR